MNDKECINCRWSSYEQVDGQEQSLTCGLDDEPTSDTAWCDAWSRDSKQDSWTPCHPL